MKHAVTIQMIKVNTNDQLITSTPSLMIMAPTFMEGVWVIMVMDTGSEKKMKMNNILASSISIVFQKSFNSLSIVF